MQGWYCFTIITTDGQVSEPICMSLRDQGKAMDKAKTFATKGNWATIDGNKCFVNSSSIARVEYERESDG